MSEEDTKRIKEVENKPIHTGRAGEKKRWTGRNKTGEKQKLSFASRRTVDSDSILPHPLLLSLHPSARLDRAAIIIGKRRDKRGHL